MLSDVPSHPLVTKAVMAAVIPVRERVRVLPLIPRRSGQWAASMGIRKQVMDVLFVLSFIYLFI